MRIYRLLLRLYPASFRKRFGKELERAFSDEYEEACRTSRRAPAAFWVRIIVDLIASAARLHYAQRGRRGTPALPTQAKRTEMETMAQDVRYAFRQFARRPGFTAIAVLSLALGIGGNTLIYGLVDGYVLHPFPYPEPDRLVAIGVTFPKVSSDTTYVEALSPAEYGDIKSSRSFASLAAFDLGNRNLAGGDVPERVFTALVLDDLFPVIGMKPALGRGFTRAELEPGGANVAIISYRLWQSRFGGDRAILDRTIRIGGQSASVVGVMPAGMLVIGTDLWIPWGGYPASLPRAVRQFTILARLAPGTSPTQANAELATLAGRVEQAHKNTFKEYDGWRLTATPLAAALMKDVRPAAVLLIGAVSLVLLIACVNLTNLFLARSTSRQRELAVRLALGAARWRLARHLLTESLLLALAGAVCGLALAQYGLAASSTFVPGPLQMLDLAAALNTRVLLWSLGLTIAAGLLVGIVPSLQASRAEPHDSLKVDGRGGAGHAGARARAVLVVAEVALSVVLLLGAGLLMRTFLNIQRVDAGFEPRGVLTFRLTLPRERYPGEGANHFFDRLNERLAAIPGVRSVAAASQYPPMAAFDTPFRLERPMDTGGSIPNALITVATPSFFESLRVPLRSGRTFAAADTLDAPRVALVNQAFAAKYMGARDPTGRRIAIGDPARERSWTTIVGVVEDYRNAGPAEPIRPEIYVPMRQQTAWNQLFVLVRAEGEPGALLGPVREVVRALDAEQPIYAVRTLEDAVAESSFQQRIAAVLLAIFAAVAVTLAAIGIFGVMSYSVTARTQEMGVRLAMGAQRSDVRWLVVRHVLKLAGTGLAIGVVVLLTMGRALEGLLFGVRPADPFTIVAVAVALGLVALSAAWIPALRASRVDPIEALRYE